MYNHPKYINHSEKKYLQICSKCGRIRPKLGLEKTPEEHIEELIKGFREIRRLLRDDGVLWLNYGDKYSDGSRTTNSQKQGNFGTDTHVPIKRAGKNCESEQGNVMLLPTQLALAMQDDGWILRDDIIWAKAVSFCPTYVGSTMPESVNGTRWERHRIKAKDEPERTKAGKLEGMRKHSGYNIQGVEWIDCPGCKKCNPNDGYVLRQGSWRCTRAHEYLFQFVKTNHYFCDAEAVKEEYKYDGRVDTKLKPTEKYQSRSYGQNPNSLHSEPQERWPDTGRNLRDVWTINPRGYADAHYATFPESLVEPCIKVSTSEKGVCPKCGAQWARMIDKKQIKRKRPSDKTNRHLQGDGVNACGNTVAGVETKTVGWKATCNCGIEETIPAIVFDPFMGSGTVAIVASKLHRHYTGIEINPKYVKEHADLRIAERKTGISVKQQKEGFKGLLG